MINFGREKRLLHMRVSESASIRQLTIIFKTPLSEFELPFFRGAIIHAIHHPDILFHNHLNNNYRYAYPLIQYKRLHGRAALVCFNEGADVIGELLSQCDFKFQLGDRNVKMEIEAIKADRFRLQIWDAPFKYRVHRWIPLNSMNYKIYTTLESIVEKAVFLEKTLTGNLLSMAKGLHIHFNKKVECKITSVSSPYLTPYKNIKMEAFNIRFSSNLSLPQYAGIGKNVSLGAGIITKIVNNKDDDNK